MDSPILAPDSPAPEILTPRTKVARLLADIDNAATPSPTSPSPKPSTDRTLSGRPAPNKSVAGPFQEESSGESEDESDSVQPHGLARRRMLGLASKPRVSSPEETSPSIVNRLSGENHFSDADQEDLYSATPARPSALSHLLASPSGDKLFVSPTKTTASDSDDELPDLPSKERLAALVAEKRAEREAKERQAELERSFQDDDEILAQADDTVNPDIERIMSDAARPARKASKKALLDMERETQRLARQQALAHQMKVKKKFTTSDLFAKFNFRQTGPPIPSDTGNDTSASSAPNSDATIADVDGLANTPPSSPPTPLDCHKSAAAAGESPRAQDCTPANAVLLDDTDDELPDIDVFMATQAVKTKVQPDDEKKRIEMKLAKLGKKAVPIRIDDSDDELEILTAMPAHPRAFDLVKAQGKKRPDNSSKAIHTLRHLAHIGHYDARSRKKGSRPSVDPTTLEAQLRRKAKEQARQEQLDRIAELKAKGIDIQTSEDREKEAEIFENLLEKARLEAVELRKMEKAARKMENGEDADAPASDDESEDEDFVASGSEDEDLGQEVDDESEENGLVDTVASETDEDEVDDENGIEKATNEGVGQEMAMDADEEAEDIPEEAVRSRRLRRARVIADEDDDDEEDSSAVPGLFRQQQTPAQDNPFAAFNFGNDNALMSPTQAFNATMQTPTQATQDDAFDILRRIAPPSASSMHIPTPTGEGYTQSQIGPEQAGLAGSQPIQLGWETQAPETPSLGSRQTVPSLNETPGWEPTQDGGLPSPFAVSLRREDTLETLPDHDTQSTVRLRISESPAAAPVSEPVRRGRLIRRQAFASDSEDDEPAAQPTEQAKQSKRNAFNEMARKRKEALTAVEQAEARKEMRGMMDEQAEESEDEYAGLGGDDFVAPENEEDREMIDSSHIDVNERAIAAHFAERERQRMEEETSKLYKDLTTGALRRKQANMFDLDDDEDEMAIRRRQIRQRDEARKRKLLLQDDNIAGLAQGKQSKGKDAFLKAIADDDDGDDMFGMSDVEIEEPLPATQDDDTAATRPQTANVLQETSGNKRRIDDNEQSQEGRPPAKQRRTQASVIRRPTSLLEVKESLSFLLEDPAGAAPQGSSILEVDSDEGAKEDEIVDEQESDHEVEAEAARENDGGFAPNPAAFDAAMMPPPRLPASQRRTAPSKTAVVDRLSLKRHGSNSSSSSDASTRNAWAAPMTAAFRVPSLLRRATTNMITTGSNDRGVTTPTLSREGSGMKMGGSRKSSLTAQARAEEKKALVEASARRRQENTARIAELRRSNTAGNLRGLGGRFE